MGAEDGLFPRRKAYHQAQDISRIVIVGVGGFSAHFLRAHWRLRSLKQGFLVALWIINDLKW
jgi:hypothetical protein